MISTQNYFHQKLYGAIFKRRISKGGDNSAAAAGITATVAVVVWWLWRGERNYKGSGAATSIEPQWKIWIYGSGDGAAAAIFKRRIVEGGDNLTTAAGIKEAVVLVAWKLWRGGGIFGTTGAMVRTAVWQWR